MIYGTRAKHVAGYHAGRTSLVSQGGKAGIAKLKYTIRDSKSDIIYLADQKDDPNPNSPPEFTSTASAKFIQKDKIKFVAGGKQTDF